MGGAQLLTAAERALFRDDYAALGLGLQIYGVSRPPRPARKTQPPMPRPIHLFIAVSLRRLGGLPSDGKLDAEIQRAFFLGAEAGGGGQ